MARLGPLLSLLGFSVLSAACASDPPPADPLAGLQVVGDDLSDVPLHGATPEQVARFKEGDALFDVVFREPDGLGPLYIRTSCASCHEGATRGPGAVDKMAVVEADGITPAADQSALPWGHTVRPYAVAGAQTPIAPPPGDPSIKRTRRLGPPIFGRGYVEAIDGAEIERVEAEQAAPGSPVSGRIDRVTFHSEANPESPYHDYQRDEVGLIGRFGFKARVATLDDFTADAYQGDMGMTSPLRPVELPNPDGLTDDQKPGTDVPLDTVNAVADYMRLLEMPDRDASAGPGLDLFTATGCAACHAPSLRTRVDYPIAALAGIDAPVFTDLLLHDMGDALADGLDDEAATSREWKTAPLIGIRHLSAYLHDGRAATVEEAILAHDGPGSEAAASVAAFRALPLEEQAALIDFVQGL